MPEDRIEPPPITFEDEYGNVWRWVDGRGYESHGKAVFVRTRTQGEHQSWWRRFVKRHIVDDAPIHDAAHSTHD